MLLNLIQIIVYNTIFPQYWLVGWLIGWVDFMAYQPWYVM